MAYPLAVKCRQQTKRYSRRAGSVAGRLEKGAESVNLKSFKYYDRMIPTQDALPEGGLGNAIALPLQGMALKAGNSAFVDENWNAYEDQLKVLAGTKRLTRQEIEDCLSLWYGAGTDGEDDGNDVPWDKNSDMESGSVKGVVHIVLADRIYIDSSGSPIRLKDSFAVWRHFQISSISRIKPWICRITMNQDSFILEATKGNILSCLGVSGKIF